MREGTPPDRALQLEPTYQCPVLMKIAKTLAVSPLHWQFPCHYTHERFLETENDSGRVNEYFVMEIIHNHWKNK